MVYVTDTECEFPVITVAGSNRILAFKQQGFVHSWRTGRRSSGSYVVPPPPSARNMQKGSNPYIERARYIKKLGENIAGQNSGRPYTAATRFLSHDTGHEFTRVKQFYGGLGYSRWDGKTTQSGLVTHGASSNYAVGPPLKNLSKVRYLTQVDGVSNAFPPSLSQLAADQNALFNSARPDASITGMGETLVELLSGNFPKVFTNLTRKAANGQLFLQSLKKTGKDLGDDYLNSMFAWRPIISDLMSLIKDLQNAHDHLYDSSFRRSRSSRPYDINTTLDATYVSVGAPSVLERLPDWYGSITTPPDYKVQVRYTSNTRLAARFTRARPSPKSLDFLEQSVEYLQMLGVWYPSLGWDLLPWSWLIDWFTHLGSAIENVSTYSKSSGTFPADYGYATTKSLYTVTGPAFSYKTQQGRQEGTVDEWVNGTITTSRIQATPFGFGVRLPDLSSSQFAILIALGLARLG